jgi:hypothetical protein
MPDSRVFIGMAMLITIGACSSNTGTPSAADAATAVPDANARDAAPDAMDSGPYAQVDAGYPHIYGATKENGTCEVNADCERGLRCECQDGSCACKAGTRGEGRSGVDACVNGNDCGSAICIETKPTFTCSDYCKTNEDCGPKVPRCLAISGFARPICLPPAGN